MKQIGKIWALVALAAAGHHFEAGAEIKGKAIDEEEKRKLLRQRQATEEEPKELVAQLKASRDVADVAAREEEAERQAEIEDTIRPAVEKIVGEMLARRPATVGAKQAPSAPDEKAIRAALGAAISDAITSGSLNELVLKAVSEAVLKATPPPVPPPAEGS